MLDLTKADQTSHHGIDPALGLHAQLSRIDRIVIGEAFQTNTSHVALALRMSAIFRACKLANGAGPRIIFLYRNQIAGGVSTQDSLSQLSQPGSPAGLLMCGFDDLERQKFHQNALGHFLYDSARRGGRIVATVAADTALWDDLLAPFKEAQYPRADFFPENQVPCPAGSGALYGTAELNLFFEARNDTVGAQLLTLAEMLLKEQRFIGLALTLRKALVAIKSSSGLLSFFSDSEEPRLDRRECDKSVLLELASSGPYPTLEKFSAQYDESSQIASEYLEEAEELAKGIWVVPASPFQERDHLASHIVRELISESSQYRFVFEYSPDFPASKLSREEAARFSSRLETGEDAAALLDELVEFLSQHGDQGRAAELDFYYHQRDRDPKSLLEQEIERAAYEPDPNGLYTLTKCPEEVRVWELVRKYGVPFKSEGALFQVNVQTGEAHPFTLQVRAEHFTMFLNYLSQLE